MKNDKTKTNWLNNCSVKIWVLTVVKELAVCGYVGKQAREKKEKKPVSACGSEKHTTWWSYSGPGQILRSRMLGKDCTVQLKE